MRLLICYRRNRWIAPLLLLQMKILKNDLSFPSLIDRNRWKIKRQFQGKKMKNLFSLQSSVQMISPILYYFLLGGLNQYSKTGLNLKYFLQGLSADRDLHMVATTIGWSWEWGWVEASSVSGVSKRENVHSRYTDSFYRYC